MVPPPENQSSEFSRGFSIPESPSFCWSEEVMTLICDATRERQAFWLRLGCKSGTKTPNKAGFKSDWERENVQKKILWYHFKRYIPSKTSTLKMFLFYYYQPFPSKISKSIRPSLEEHDHWYIVALYFFIHEFWMSLVAVLIPISENSNRAPS